MSEMMPGDGIRPSVEEYLDSQRLRAMRLPPGKGTAGEQGAPFGSPKDDKPVPHRPLAETMASQDAQSRDSRDQPVATKPVLPADLREVVRSFLALRVPPDYHYGSSRGGLQRILPRRTIGAWHILYESGDGRGDSGPRMSLYEDGKISGLHENWSESLGARMELHGLSNWKGVRYIDPSGSSYGLNVLRLDDGTLTRAVTEVLAAKARLCRDMGVRKYRRFVK